MPLGVGRGATINCVGPSLLSRTPRNESFFQCSFYFRDNRYESRRVLNMTENRPGSADRRRFTAKAFSGRRRISVRCVFLVSEPSVDVIFSIDTVFSCSLNRYCLFDNDVVWEGRCTVISTADTFEFLLYTRFEMTFFTKTWSIAICQCKRLLNWYRGRFSWHYFRTDFVSYGTIRRTVFTPIFMITAQTGKVFEDFYRFSICQKTLRMFYLISRSLLNHVYHISRALHECPCRIS